MSTVTDTDIQTTPFYLDSLVSTQAGSTAPVTEFAAGEDIQLAWDSNGTSFALYEAKDPTPIYTGTDTSYTVKGGRTASTTFILVASVTGGTASGSPYPGFQEITLIDALTVGISNPTITPASVTAGTLSVTGATTLQDVTATGSAQVGGTLNVTGAATLSGGATVGGLTVNGPTNLSGGATIDTATVSGSLSAGSSSLGNATASTLSVANSVAMLSPRSIAAGSYTASTDGLVVGTVSWPGDAGKKCSAIASGWSPGVGNVYATGGNDVMWTNGDDSWMWIVGGSFVLPVSAGAPFSIGVTQVGGADVAAPVAFSWVPFGTNASLTEITDEAAAAAGFVAPKLPEASPPHPFDPDFAISEIIDIFGEVSGAPLSQEEQDRLTGALQVLATHDASHTWVPTV